VLSPGNGRKGFDHELLKSALFCGCGRRIEFFGRQAILTSQQSLSDYIKNLEEEYGVRLFQRSHHITLAEAGQSLYSNAKESLALQSKAEKEPLDIKDFRKGIIALCIVLSRGFVMLPPIDRILPQVPPGPHSCLLGGQYAASGAACQWQDCSSHRL